MRYDAVITLVSTYSVSVEVDDWTEAQRVALDAIGAYPPEETHTDITLTRFPEKT